MKKNEEVTVFLKDGSSVVGVLIHSDDHKGYLTIKTDSQHLVRISYKNISDIYWF